LTDTIKVQKSTLNFSDVGLVSSIRWDDVADRAGRYSPSDAGRAKRKGKPEDLLTKQHPHLRIIDQELWDRAQQVRTSRTRPTQARRVYKKTIVKHLLAGRLTCGTCGGDMRIVGSKAGEHTRVGCSSARDKGICSNSKSYDLVEIEATVLDGIKNRLDVEALTAYTAGAHKEWETRHKAARTEYHVVKRDLDRTIEKIDRIVTAMTDTTLPLEPLKEKYKALELERAGLADKLRLVEADGGNKVVTLHPAMIQKFRENLLTMVEALTNIKLTEAEIAPFRVAFGNVFDRVVLHRTGKRRPVEVTPLCQNFRDHGR
jgi:site-specific DNA recombinase